ncbi:SUKH-3 domain-containing protein [Bradyrhizobium paxllaeri]|uniref:SUKH-3 domain-containing protein n=1 Tax=Bradyrhizobium paxllaeri TaxID=190148 RepID=UPI000A038D1F|nr:SUKH-3 domain-containing protein [Bradyrhizobium paxllaeri]
MAEMWTTVPASVRPLFVAAGWRPGRTVALSPALRANHPATAILAEFGGLTVGQTGAGEECAKSDVAFRELSPDDLVLGVWDKLLQTQLVGIADVHHAHAELYVDSSGRCFTASVVDDGFSFEGATFGEAIERLLLGRRSRPMLRPDQNTVRHYGEEIRIDDPRVYQYR